MKEIITLCLFAGTACLVLAEIVLRLAGLGMPWNMDNFGRRVSASITTQGKGVVVAAGDSLTFGTRVLEKDSYPSRLAAFVKEKWSGGQVVNMGICGHTSSQLLERLDRDVLAVDPQVVVLGIGANDAMLKKKRDCKKKGKRPFDRPPILARSVLISTLDAIPAVMGWVSRLLRPTKDFHELQQRVPLKIFQENLRSIILRLQTHGVESLVLLTIPRFPKSFSRYPEHLERQRQSNESYNRIIRDFALEFDLPLVELQRLLTDEHFLADGLHPTPAGYGLIVDELREILGRM